MRWGPSNGAPYAAGRSNACRPLVAGGLHRSLPPALNGGLRAMRAAPSVLRWHSSERGAERVAGAYG
jgi:hypothetical protein